MTDPSLEDELPNQLPFLFNEMATKDYKHFYKITWNKKASFPMTFDSE